MRLYSSIKHGDCKVRRIRAIEILGTLVMIVAAAAVAHAQYRAIPNYVGIGAGLQFRNDVNNHLSGITPIAPRIVTLPFLQLPTEQDGQEYWCSDCQATSPCLGVGHGALALGVQGQWSCTSGSPPGTAFPLAADVSAGTHKIKNLALNSTTGDALSQGQSHLNDLTTANATYNMGANRLQNLGSGSTSGDALSFGQTGATLSGLNLNSNPLGGLSAGTAAGQALAFAQSGAQLTTNNATIAVVSSNLAGPSSSPLSITTPTGVTAGRALMLTFAVGGSTPGITLP